MTVHAAGIIERAFQLAQQLTTVDEIRSQLRKEGYSSVDAHLMGRKIRSDLVKIIRQAA
ncbi:hypothetical protein [Sphingomonas sp.]|uniref:hypothetical protein n=1 Tax=Sphingomonas sp. TaxID=28214 RepID=UPI0025F0B329|nr:hypothetical protein [Sphingomonas sp.]